MKVNMSEDRDLKEGLDKLTKDKSHIASVIKTFNDVCGAYFSACYHFGDHCALVGSDTFVDFINEYKAEKRAIDFFNHLDDSVWLNGVLALAILLGVDSQEGKHRSIYRLECDLQKLGVILPDIKIEYDDKKKIKDYRNNRVAHWNYRNTKIENLEYDLPVRVLNGIRAYIIEVYYKLTEVELGIISVKERALDRSTDVAVLFGCMDIVDKMKSDIEGKV